MGCSNPHPHCQVSHTASASVSIRYDLLVLIDTFSLLQYSSAQTKCFSIRVVGRMNIVAGGIGQICVVLI